MEHLQNAIRELELALVEIDLSGCSTCKLHLKQSLDESRQRLIAARAEYVTALDRA